MDKESYENIASKLGGQIIKLTPEKDGLINPLEIHFADENDHPESEGKEKVEHPVIDETLSNLLNKVFAWSQHIRREAQKSKNDGIDDDALIIQEAIEDYLHDRGLNPRDVIEYEKHQIHSKRRYDK